MAGDQQAYERAMQAGHNAAWDQEWQMAVAAYGRAVREFPGDPEAHIHLGLGLLEIGRLEDALKVYQRAHQLDGGDPIPLEKSADVLERMGRLREAAQQYVNVAEVYITQRDLDKAIRNWERATRLTPSLIPIHAKLAQAYERIGDKRKAIFHYLTLAFNFKRLDDVEKALRAAKRAQRLDPNNAKVANSIRALESGGSILPPVDEDSPRARDDDRRQVTKPAAPTGDPLGPMGEAINHALSALATSIMEDANALSIASDALKAMEAHRQGDYAAAIDLYKRADSQMRHPAIKMSLGAMHLLAGNPGEALKPLNEATQHPQMAGGALHGLGQALYAQGKHRPAGRSLVQAMQSVDASDDGSYAEDGSVYRHILRLIDQVNDDQIKAIVARLITQLKGADWQVRLSDFRRQTEDIWREQGDAGLIDFLIAEGSDQLMSSITLIDRSIRQGLFTLAMDEAHRAVQISPYYLPVHVRMAEIMFKEGRVRQAIAKYNTIAKSYLARGENERAAKILHDVIEVAPLDVDVRYNLINLLEMEERWDEVLEQHIQLADTHHQLSNVDRARETYQLAERIGSRIGAPAERMVYIKHRIADIDQTRLDLKRAQKAYEEIIELSPDDERAYRMLVDLHYRQGSRVEAVRRLDKLLGIYARKRQISTITSLLEELVTLYPDDTGLRSRIAAIYKQIGKKREAIEQLDALGELQLEAGLNKEAAATIRQIISLNPENMDAYRQLLQQLGG